MPARSGLAVRPGRVAGVPAEVGLGGLAGQASTQAPPERVRPRPARVRRLIAAHRLCSQASFLAVPM